MEQRNKPEMDVEAMLLEQALREGGISIPPERARHIYIFCRSYYNALFWHGAGFSTYGYF